MPVRPSINIYIAETFTFFFLFPIDIIKDLDEPADFILINFFYFRFLHDEHSALFDA